MIFSAEESKGITVTLTPFWAQALGVAALIPKSRATT